MARLTWHPERSKQARWAALIGAACALGSLGGCRRAPRFREPPPEPYAPSDVVVPARDVVAGVVVRGDGRPLPDALVATNGAHVATDEHGRFTLSGVAEEYSITIVDPSQTRVTVYQGLTRRDPLLVFQDDAKSRKYAHHATISGKLSGGGSYPVEEEMSVHFASRYASAEFPLGRGDMPEQRGPRFGPLHVAWNGPERIGGEVLALRTPRGKTSGAAWARLPLELAANETREVELPLVQLAMLERPASRLAIEPGVQGTPQLREHYRLPGVGVVFSAVGALTGPHGEADLRKEGIVLCASASIWDPLYRGQEERCDFAHDKPAELALRAPPALLEPAFGTPASVGLRFSWSAVPDAVYRLTLAPTHADASTPEIRILTSQLSTTWPDLENVGIHFPRPVVAYAASLGALGPYEALDHAAGPDGLAATVPRHAWFSEAAPVSVPIAHPLGKAAAACKVALDAKLSCPTATGKPALYSLAIVNHKLRHYPELAAASGVHCVRDCSAALNYTRAYEVYSREHPGFDSDEPPLAPPSVP